MHTDELRQLADAHEHTRTGGIDCRCDLRASSRPLPAGCSRCCAHTPTQPHRAGCPNGDR